MSALLKDRSLSERLRRLGTRNSFYIKDAHVGTSTLRPAMVRLVNTRLILYAMTQGLTRVEQHGRLSPRGVNMMLNINIGVGFINGEQDTYQYVNLWWRSYPAIANVAEKQFNSGYFPEDYNNAIRYCQEMFDEAIIIPSVSFSNFLRSGTRYYLDLEGEPIDQDAPF